tara:strand:+ start:195 stop:473 length:279 start_codon:yes stop_codon:yes gene_type:complete
MAISSKTDLVVEKYSRQPYPVLEEGQRKYIQDELQRIEQSVARLADAAIQVADAAPDNPVKGMVRYAVTGWDPLGNSFQGLVVYNGNAWVAV